MSEDKINPTQEKWLLVATIVASGLAFIDFSAINVALPAIQKEFDLKGKQLLWIVNSYTLLLSALILLGGTLGDYFGRKKVFIIGILVFTCSSLICGLAPGQYVLIGGRALQGIGGALMVPGSLSIISALIPNSRRGRAFGTWSTFSALTTIIGPVLGGWLAGAGLWRVIFFINIPLAAVAIVILWKKIPESKNEQNTPLDWLGGLLVTLGLSGISYAFIEASEKGWLQPAIIFTLIGGIVFFVLFILREARFKFPMMPLQLYRNSTFSGANLLTLLVYGALNITLFFLPLNLVQVQGYSEFNAGLAILPFALIIALLSRIVGSMIDRLGNRVFLITGPVLTAVGFWFLSSTGLTAGASQYFDTFFLPVVIIAIGMGLTVAPLTTSVMSAVAESNAGIASGINNAVARTAGVLSIAIVGTIAIADFENRMQHQYQQLDLQPEEIVAIEQEVDKLAEANPPDLLTEEQQLALQNMIDRSFIYTFQKIGKIAAIIAFSAGFVAFFTIRN